MNHNLVHYLTFFCIAGAAGLSWYCFFVGWGMTRQRFRWVRVVSSFLAPGWISVGVTALHYGGSICDNWHQAIGVSAIIGISGVPCWVLASSMGTALIKQVMRFRITRVNGSEPDDE